MKNNFFNKIGSFLFILMTFALNDARAMVKNKALQEQALSWWNSHKQRTHCDQDKNFYCNSPLQRCGMRKRTIDEQITHVINTHVPAKFRRVIRKGRMRRDLLHLIQEKSQKTSECEIIEDDQVLSGSDNVRTFPIIVGPGCEFQELSANNFPIHFYCTTPGHGPFSLEGALDHFIKQCHDDDFPAMTHEEVRDSLSTAAARKQEALKKALLKNKPGITCNSCKKLKPTSTLLQHTVHCWRIQQKKQQQKLDRRKNG
jgi:hypothetical protein